MEFARQQLNEENLGTKDFDLDEVELKDGQAGKTSSPLNKKASRNVEPAKKSQHVPREPQEGQLVNYEHDSMPRLPKASKEIVLEDLIKAPKALDASVFIEDVMALKKPKLRSKKTNPLTKSFKKMKMSSAKKPAATVLPPSPENDEDLRSLGGLGRLEGYLDFFLNLALALELTDSETIKTTDYEDDPSTFRGKDGPKDDIDNDYEQDPSTFRGKQEVEFLDYESDPSTFRGKQE